MYGSAQLVHGYSININRPTLSEMRSSQKNQEKPSTHNWTNRRHGQLPLKLGFTHDYRIMSFRGFAQFLSCWNVWVRCVQPNLRAAVEYGNSTYKHNNTNCPNYSTFYNITPIMSPLFYQILECDASKFLIDFVGLLNIKCFC